MPGRPPYNKIRANIKARATDKPFLLAVSGGVDSMWMWDFVAGCNVPYAVAHYAHQIRSVEDTSKDIDLIKRMSDRYKVELFVGYGHDLIAKARDTGLGLEAVARDARYTYLRSVTRLDRISDTIITAHHADDQVETVLLNLMRGVDHNKLAMREQNGDVFRPFLSVAKSDIMFHASKRRLEWNDDITNSSTHHDRNWLRNVVIPLLSERRNITESILTGVRKTHEG